MARSESSRHAELIDEIVDEARAYQRAVDLLDETAAARLGINRVDARCLDTIHHLGPLSAGELAQAMGLSASSMTLVLDRLERVGYTKRVRDKVDRRRVIIEMTEKARRRAMAIYGPIAAENAAKFAGYSRRDLELLRDFFRAEREAYARYLARVEAMPIPRRRG